MTPDEQTEKEAVIQKLQENYRSWANAYFGTDIPSKEIEADLGNHGLTYLKELFERVSSHGCIGCEFSAPFYCAHNPDMGGADGAKRDIPFICPLYQTADLIAGQLTTMIEQRPERRPQDEQLFWLQIHINEALDRINRLLEDQS